jgi:peptide/nickel transport system substrate-binding protein
MDKRFGVKDFILFVLLAALIGVVVLAMYQYDRQFKDVLSIRKDLDEVKNMLARGVSLGTPSTTIAGGSSGRGASTNPADYPGDPFARLKAAQAISGYAPGDWLVESNMGNIASLTPFVATDLYARYVFDVVLETLAQRDPMTLEWSGLLADKWEQENNVGKYDQYVEAEKKKGRKEEDISKDPACPTPVTLTFTLRDGIHFSDGQPITPDDFVWTFNWIMNEKVAAARDRSAYEKVKSVQKKGANQVVFKFREPYYASMAVAASTYALPRHFYEKYTPEQFNQSVGLLIGSGPYRLEDPAAWKPGTGQVVLVRNERYWGVQPAFERIVFKEITLDVARQTAFRNGEIDLFEARPEQYDGMKKDPQLVARAQHYDWLSLNGGYRYVAWQQLKDGKPTMFADKRVRRAMAMLVDRRRLVQEVMLGYAELASGPFSPVGIQYDKRIQPPPYDVAAAKKLLAEAGFKDTNGDGVLDTPAGKPFRFKLTYPSGSPNYEKMVLAFKDAYARAGIVLDPDPLEWAVFASKLRNKDFEAVTLGWGGGDPESDVYQMFDSSQTVVGGDNFMCYINPEFDAAIRTARRETDEKKRIPLWFKCHQILNDDQPYMFLWFTKEMFFIDGRLRNVQPTPVGLTPGIQIEWFAPRDRQKWTR